MTRNKSFNNGPLLYLVATPIGNLKEISKRALDVFESADIIAAEDTRNTYSLLANYGIKKELFSLREHNEIEASKHLIRLIKDGKQIVYVSDAGYPGISDPGYLLVQEAIKDGINISTVSGSSAFINALVASGLPTDHFYFYGFLSKKGNEAKEALESLKSKEETLIFYESPHHIKKTLELMFEVLGNRDAVIARELTKLNEEYIRGSLKELSEIDEETLKGEMVVLIRGKEKSEEEITDEVIKEKLLYYMNYKIDKKTAIELVKNDFNVGKNRVYKIATEL